MGWGLMGAGEPPSNPCEPQLGKQHKGERLQSLQGPGRAPPKEAASCTGEHILQKLQPKTLMRGLQRCLWVLNDPPSIFLSVSYRGAGVPQKEPVPTLTSLPCPQGKGEPGWVVHPDIETQGFIK